MAIRVALRHTTRYVYDRPVTLSPQVVRLRPAPHCRSPIEAYSLRVRPEQHFIDWQQDPFGNYLSRLVFPEPTREFCVDVELVANLVTINPFDLFLEESAEKYPFEYEPQLHRDLYAYLQPCATGREFATLVDEIRREFVAEPRCLVDVLVDVNRLIQRGLHYDIRMEPGVFAPEETLERGRGSCRDFAWLLTNVLRTLGIAARFVSGYLIRLRADQKSLEGPAGVDSDCADLHAWAEAYLPGAGWVGLDATSGLLCGEGHIPLSCTAEPSHAAPVTGGHVHEKTGEDDKCNEHFEFVMRVERIEDRPRPTRPYTEEQWSAIVACGNRVEQSLRDNDVRLTMGGEPTFVSIDDQEGDEWNTAALGPMKERLADSLVRRLRHEFCSGGLLHHGQGQWYPGERLPRWAYGCYFRRDGEVIWHDDAWISDGFDGRATPEQARHFIETLAHHLSLGTNTIQPGFEDVFYYLWRERRLPVNVDPFDSHVEDELERARLRRVFDQGLKQIIGYALPLRAVTQSDGSWEWETGRWFLRDERLYLSPGDSPMGFRLPLDSLPWSVEGDHEPFLERDPFALRPALPSYRRLLLSSGAHVSGEQEHVPERGKGAGNIVRSALCIEPRRGVIHVFMPPIAWLEPYLHLVAQIEQTASELQIPVRVEGYEPPRDPRLERILVTPDSGVIEVHIHPARSWEELVSNTTVLYEQARLTRLGTEKFMLDGRHTGTGGGNHLVLGGATAGDSPFLRRPDLLRSFTSFFNNHPALSYLFSGLFVGPTSQAPRVDEARQDSLYELELAFRALEAKTEQHPPWLVDRLFRDLLVDVTGNTRRAEFCIDKLYNPEGSGGRQGLLEMRAFEMPPDARMSLAQQLLIRALLAMFWKQPYTRPLQRWGTSIHDRSSLPYFVWEDLADLVSELGVDGCGMDPEWFRPHWEFRFPRYGAIHAQGVELELRQAIEPWHVLGEEGMIEGTVRYVDSSAERVQVLVNGLVDTRYTVLVNGNAVPLHPTGRAGQYVAGVRYKAWKATRSLHPSLPVNAPLVFDVFDRWACRAIGGCTYYVSHPGARTYDQCPTNGLEAESRRMARFQPWGHGPATQAPPAPTRSLEHPLTLDLRGRVSCR